MTTVPDQRLATAALVSMRSAARVSHAIGASYLQGTLMSGGVSTESVARQCSALTMDQTERGALVALAPGWSMSKQRTADCLVAMGLCAQPAAARFVTMEPASYNSTLQAPLSSD